MRTAKYIVTLALTLGLTAGPALAQTSSGSPPSGSSGSSEPVPGDKEPKPKAEDTKRFKIPAADKPKDSSKKPN